MDLSEEILKKYNELSETELLYAFGNEPPIETLNNYMTKLRQSVKNAQLPSLVITKFDKLRNKYSQV